jgi:hypothetical protein
LPEVPILIFQERFEQSALTSGTFDAERKSARSEQFAFG